MNDKQDPIAHAARLLREAAEELRQAHMHPRSKCWDNDTDAKAVYDEHMAAAQQLEDWEQAIGAGGVQARSAAPAWADQAVIEYQYTGGTHWCPLGPAERMKPDFDGVYRLQAGVYPVEQAAPKAAPQSTCDCQQGQVCGVCDPIRPVNAAPQQEAQEPTTVPRFTCWSTNEGDSWFDHPADSQAIYDCLGSDAKVGDEYELTAGWKSVTARYRITEVVGDGEDYEVECISHPQENTAPQPAPAPLSEREAFERWYITSTRQSLPSAGDGWSDDQIRDSFMCAGTNGKYRSSGAQIAWEGWQACAALAAQGGK